jgi:hypothetical protein
MLLTVDPAFHAERSLAAAQASLQAGAFGEALELLAGTELGGAGRLDEFASARVDLPRAQVAFGAGLGSDAPPLLLRAARRLEPLNLDLARESYLDAWGAAIFAGRVAAGDLLEICPFGGRLRFSTRMCAAQRSNSTRPPLSEPMEKSVVRRCNLKLHGRAVNGANHRIHPPPTRPHHRLAMKPRTRRPGDFPSRGVRLPELEIT